MWLFSRTKYGEVRRKLRLRNSTGCHGRARIGPYGHSRIQTLRHGARDSFMLFWGHCGLYLESGDERKTLIEPEPWLETTQCFVGTSLVDARFRQQLLKVERVDGREQKLNCIAHWAILHSSRR